MSKTHVSPAKPLAGNTSHEITSLDSFPSELRYLDRLGPDPSRSFSALISKHFLPVSSELPWPLRHTVGQLSFESFKTIRRFCEDPSFHRSVDQAIQTLIRRSTRLPFDQAIPTLLLTQAIAARLLAGGLSIDVGKKSTTTETLIVALQRKCPDSAVALATAALTAGVTLSPNTLLSTIALGVKSALSPRDVIAVSTLATLTIQKDAIDLQSPGVMGVFDAFLGSCGEPGVTSSRISPNYRERDILDSATRLYALVPLVHILMTKAVPFDTERTVDRVNMVARALCSSALMLNIERVRTFEHLPHSELHLLRKATGVDITWFSIPPSRLAAFDPVPLSSSLVSAAIAIVDLAIGHTRDIDQFIMPRYEINGSTINLLFNACFFDETGLAPEKVSVLRSILDRALEAPLLRRKLHSANIENGILSTLAATRGAPDPGPLLMDSAAMLATAMRSGFGFMESRIRMVYKRCVDSIAEPAQSGRWTEDFGFLQAKIQKLDSPPQPSTYKFIPPLEPKTLRGGLDSMDTLYMHSFGELAKAYRVA
jgi:hypothetical protein